MVTYPAGKACCAALLLVAIATFNSFPLRAESRATNSFGKEIRLTKTLPLREAVKHPERYKDRTVLLEGRIKDVCQMKGCWLVLTDGDDTIRIKFEGYSFFVPKDSRGKQARVEGKLIWETISEAMARHYASEQSQPPDLSQMRGPQKVVSFEASGVQIFK
jgi:hypothetical protein